MNKEEIKGLIANAMITDRMLELIDEHKTDEAITLKEIRNKWNEECKIDVRFGFINMHQYVINLLPRIVLAYEFFSTEMKRVNISELSEEWAIKNICIKGKNIKTLKDFIRRLRNSISHGNFEIGNLKISHNDEFTYHFNDKNPKDSTDVFECILKYSDLRSFVSAFTKWINTQYEPLYP